MLAARLLHATPRAHGVLFRMGGSLTQFARVQVTPYKWRDFGNSAPPTTTQATIKKLQKPQHFKTSRPSYAVPPEEYHMPHPVWSEQYTETVPVTHEPKKDFGDWLAYVLVQAARFNFDYVSGYKFGKMSERKWLVRMVFLETVAGCPGFVAGMLRHMRSLRKMEHDNGWIHTLLEEAENERMHLLTFIHLYNPGPFFRLGVVLTQGLVSNALFLAYMISPRVVHRFVGYLEEEAVKTYTHCLKDIDTPGGALNHWQTQAAPPLAIQYWQLSPEATMRDVIAQVRADESHHRDVNHVLSDLSRKDHAKNPYGPGH